MFGRLFKALSLLLLGWFAFVFGAVAYAKLFGPAPRQPEPDADELDLVATFGPLEFTSTARSFRGGDVTTWFGGGTVDLTGATLAPDGATLRVHALFGGGNLVVPDSWRVETRVIGIGGVGVAPGMASPASDAPVLRVEGTAIFGGWGVTSAPAKDDLAAQAALAGIEDAAGA